MSICGRMTSGKTVFFSYEEIGQEFKELLDFDNFQRKIGTRLHRVCKVCWFKFSIIESS